MTPSEQCKHEGLESFAEMIRISGIPKSTLKDWHRDKPGVFQIALYGCIYKKALDN